MTKAELLAEQLDGSRQWTLKLLADFAGHEWTFQPRPGLQHALWLAGHLTVAAHLLVMVRCLGRSVLDDDFAAHFAIGGPVKSAAEHDYPPPELVRATMDRTHACVLEAIRSMSDAKLCEPAYGKDGAPHPHYATVAGAVGHASRHEAFHAGQIALLRRLLGKQFLR